MFCFADSDLHLPLLLIDNFSLVSILTILPIDPADMFARADSVTIFFFCELDIFCLVSVE